MDETLLGAILVRTAKLPLKTLQEALEEQKRSKKRLGDILMAAGAITREQLALALEIQREKRGRI